MEEHFSTEIGTEDVLKAATGNGLLLRIFDQKCCISCGFWNIQNRAQEKCSRIEILLSSNGPVLLKTEEARGCAVLGPSPTG
jgi:hypothetical protein